MGTNELTLESALAQAESDIQRINKGQPLAKTNLTSEESKESE